MKGSFSAVSKLNFASKYALESSRRDLHNALLCTALQSQLFKQARLLHALVRELDEVVGDGAEERLVGVARRLAVPDQDDAPGQPFGCTARSGKL